MTSVFKDQEERQSEWKAVKKWYETSSHEEGDKWRREDNGLKHSFILIDNKLLAMAEKGEYLGSGAFGQVKLAEDESGHLYAIKIQHQPHTGEMKNNVDVGLAYGMADRMSKTEKLYIEDGAGGNKDKRGYRKYYHLLEYLGVSLPIYAKKNPLSLDQSYQLAIRLALKLYILHSGQRGIPYNHGDPHIMNFVIDDKGEPHWIDFGKSSRRNMTPNTLCYDLFNFIQKCLLPERSYDHAPTYKNGIFHKWLFREIKFGMPDTVTEHDTTLYVQENKDKKGLQYRVRFNSEIKEGLITFDELEEWDRFKDYSPLSALYDDIIKIVTQRGHIPNMEPLKTLLTPDRYTFPKIKDTLDLALQLTLIRVGLESCEDEWLGCDREAIVSRLNECSDTINDQLHTLQNIKEELNIAIITAPPKPKKTSNFLQLFGLFTQRSGTKFVTTIAEDMYQLDSSFKKYWIAYAKNDTANMEKHKSVIHDNLELLIEKNSGDITSLSAFKQKWSLDTGINFKKR